MKRIIKMAACFLLAICLVIPVPTHAASLGISASTGSVSPGGSFTVYISGSGCTGRINISVSNGSASSSSVWVENSSASVTVRAGSSGSCTVTATPAAGLSDDYGDPVSVGSRSTSVSIVSSSSSSKPTAGSSKPSSSSSSASSTKQPAKTEEVDAETGKVYAITAIENQTYTGKKIKPDVQVTCDGTALVKDTDYTVKYSNNVKAGTATVTVEGMGSHDFALSGSFNIVAKDISGLKLPVIDEQKFTGEEVKPAVELLDGSKTLKEGTDYTIKYENNVDAGTAIVTITGTGNYTGTATIEFEIVEALFAPGCVSHWVILGIALVAAALIAVLRKKEVFVLAVMAVAFVINTVVAFAAGNCTGEWVMAYFGLAVMVLVKWITSGNGKISISRSEN